MVTYQWDWACANCLNHRSAWLDKGSYSIIAGAGWYALADEPVNELFLKSIMLVSSQLCRLAEQVKKLRLIEAEIWSLRSRLNSHSSNFGHCVYNSSYCSFDHSSRTYHTLKRTRYSKAKCTSVSDTVKFFSNDSGDKSDESIPVTEDICEITENEKPDLTDAAVLNNSVACNNRLTEQNLLLEAEAEPRKNSDVKFNAYSSERNVESYLEDMGMPYNEGYTCFTSVCPKLGKLAMKKKKLEDILYVNSTSGKFES